jgi:hypothetical protein
MESETRTAEIVEQERDQLICDLFEAVNVMYPPALGESLEVMTSRLIDLKRKISTLDPNWIFVDSSNYYVFRILFCISRLDVRDSANFCTNRDLCLKIFHGARIMKNINPSWHLDGKVIIQFLKANSERMESINVDKPSYIP